MASRKRKTEERATEPEETQPIKDTGPSPEFLEGRRQGLRDSIESLLKATEGRGMPYHIHELLQKLRDEVDPPTADNSSVEGGDA